MGIDGNRWESDRNLKGVRWESEGNPKGIDGTRWTFSISIQVIDAGCVQNPDSQLAFVDGNQSQQVCIALGGC